MENRQTPWGIYFLLSLIVSIPTVLSVYTLAEVQDLRNKSLDMHKRVKRTSYQIKQMKGQKEEIRKEINRIREELDLLEDVLLEDVAEGTEG
jgi:uncharacterized coiled-coil DUF342 family protein